jgi:arylsulfatase A-like enzyme/Tfp pilus assembly protein PilF
MSLVFLTLALGALAALAAGRVHWIPGKPHGPNLLLVTIDTLRADHVGAYGADFARTPTLDGVALRGTRFETVISPTPLTLPSHASLLTGRYPPGHGVRHNGLFELADSELTLTERLERAGFATGAVIGAFVVAEAYGLSQGFSHYDDEELWGRRAGAGGYLERTAEEVTDRSLTWLAAQQDPFFLWVHYYDPHADYRPPPPFDSRFPERPYDGEVAYVDAQLGRLLDGLRTSGRLEDTLVVVTSDHGESLGEHGEPTHSYTLHDGSLRVPLLLAGPEVPRGLVVSDLASSVDVAPTLLELLGLPALPRADGRSLVPHLTGSGSETEPIAYAETYAPRYEHGWAPLFAARSRDSFYVKAPRPELYDLNDDPGQLHNRLESDDADALARAEALDRAIEPLVAQAPDGPDRVLDSETREQLAALGYAIAAEPVGETDIDPKDGLAALEDLNRARAAFEAHELERAEEFLERLLAKLPESPRAHSLQARVHLVRADYAKALVHLEQATRSVPRSALYRSLMGDARAGLGDLKGAVAEYEHAVRLDDQCAPAHVGLMLRARLGGSLADAEAHARRATEIMPYSEELHVHMATLWSRLGHPERSIAAALQALRHNPDSERAHAEVAIQLVGLGRAQEAEPHLAAASGLHRDARLANRLAVAHASAGSLDSAEALLRGLLERHPDHAGARRNLARVMERSGRAGAADAAATP